MPSVKMPTPIRPKKANGRQVNTWWLRKKVPEKLRSLVGKSEVWRSLDTTDLRTANQRIGQISAAIEAEWAYLAGQHVAHSKSVAAFEAPPLTHRERLALRRIAHVAARDAYIEEPLGFTAMRMTAALPDPFDVDGAAALDDAVSDFLKQEGASTSPDDVERFKPMYLQARRDAVADVHRAAKNDYSDHPRLAKLPARSIPKLDILQAFEEYVENGALKGGKDGPTAKRWRPKIAAFSKWLKHRDLAQMTTADGYKWADYLKAEGYAEKSIRDVWIASLSATAGFMVERRQLNQNPFLQIRVRNSVATNTRPPRKKGFTKKEAEAILTATLERHSHLISEEMAAARRWVPWLCAYSGARVNEVTSLYPADIAKDKETGIWCMQIKPSLEKTAQWRTVAIHSHIIEQGGFLEYVEKRRKTGKPLFYDPSRSKGGKAGNPQFKKVAERLAEWLHSKNLVPEGIKPNHGWRHAFKSLARRIPMDREVEGHITGHRPKDSNSGFDYGDRWAETMSIEIEKYPAFRIPALKAPPAPHKRVRRTRAQIEADEAAKEARKDARATRAA
jgi:site-specific recombinase XerD